MKDWYLAFKEPLSTATLPLRAAAPHPTSPSRPRSRRDAMVAAVTKIQTVQVLQSNC